MQFDIQKTISPFISSQFPEFYKTEGPNFILFVQAYYEFMEQQYGPTYAANGESTSTNVLYQGRNLLNYRDLDNTLESFLEHFQKKYLYGIPFNVIINKRFLLKHILDVYRSKGSIQCYRLLFKLIYNEDIEVYLPGIDLLAPSDGTWVVPTYIEVTQTSYLPNMVGQTIIGLASNTTAVVESYITEPINNNIVASLYISNMSPKGGAFIEGEKIINLVNKNSANLASIVAVAPVITGSLNNLFIINGGQGFNVGDILGVVHRDPSNNAVVSFGINGVVRVSQLTQGFGTLNFSISKSGFGITNAPTVLVYSGNGNSAGAGASFAVGALGAVQSVTYNTDVIANYLTTVINATAYSFPGNATANLSSNIGTTFTYANNTFGSLLSLTNIKTGNGYTQQANVFVESVENSLALPGTVTYSTAANTITGSGTNFTWYFVNNSIIGIQANSTSSTFEYQAIKQVVSDTSLILYGTPAFASNGTSNFYVCPAIFPANFTPPDPLMLTEDGSINGLNSLVSGFPSTGNSIVGAVQTYDSGKGYVDGEQVELYLYSGVNTPTVVAGGKNYSNGDALVFTGGGGTIANGFVTTNTSGGIVSATVIYAGSGLQSIPTILVQSNTGTGAKLTTTLSQYNTTSQVLAKVIKGGVGKHSGYWSTTKGFLNSDKYIQDSYFYQDYSYQIKAASQLASYKDILYNTFHPSGSELFGEFQLITTLNAPASILYDASIPQPAPVMWLTVDMSAITVDAANTTAIPTKYTVDEVVLNPFTADAGIYTVDTNGITADQY
ncbi:MAG: hypothetical protein ACXV2C_00695 [Candidatus Bathyarchaeia archaeon]